ncbi:DUF2235 domain-containing protein [Microdochium nivale]|nr:DUF2235 domain-containing protein [Microdochium nivale]
MADTAEKPTRQKRLIVCCDGTWQSSVALQRNIPSNVTRLARSFARTDETDPNVIWDQVVYYNAGIGTGEISTIEAIRQGGVGSGFSGNVIEAYNFLVLNYRPGDKIYCFGFSRGAYTARAVAGLVNSIGIISPRDMQDFPDLYNKYEWPSKDHDTSNPNWFRESDYYREWRYGVHARSSTGGAAKIEGTSLKLYEKFPHEPVLEASRQVEVVGVFDTVGSLGIPDTAMHSFNAIKSGIRWVTGGGTAPGFHNVSLSRYTRNAFHALALDEHRGPFSPTLWDLPKAQATDTRTSEELQKDYDENYKTFHVLFDKFPQHSEDEPKEHAKELKALNEAWKNLMHSDMVLHRCESSQNYLAESNLDQVWFPGYHCNIGGGDSDALETRKGDLEQIALISFAWMCDKIKPFLRFEDKLRKRTVGDRMAMVNPILAELKLTGAKDFGSGITKSFWKFADAVVPGYKAPKKTVSDLTTCGWATGPIVDSFTAEYYLAKNIVRTPGQYNLGVTNEKIHPCVAYRMAMLQGDRLAKGEEAYKPAALAGFERVYLKDGWKWVKGKVSIDEVDISGKLKFSYFMAKDHVKYLDQVVIQKTRSKKGAKAQEKELEANNAVCDTPAIRFLEATKEGEGWEAPPIGK